MRYLRSLILIILLLVLSIGCDIFKRDREIADIEFFYVPSSGVGEYDGYMYWWFWTGYIRVNNGVQVRVVGSEEIWIDMEGNILGHTISTSGRSFCGPYRGYGIKNCTIIPGTTYCHQFFAYHNDPSYGFKFIEIVYGIDENLNEVTARAEYIGYPGGEGHENQEDFNVWSGIWPKMQP